MAINIAINGFGRIGRSVVRALYELGLNDKIRIKAINEKASSQAIAHLLKYDSAHGIFQQEVEVEGEHLYLFDAKAFEIRDLNGELSYSSANRLAHEGILLSQATELDDLPWDELSIDLVLDCTGVYGDKAAGFKYQQKGCKRVIFSHPGSCDLDATIIYGINHDQLTKDHQFISNGSCTTNCIIPIIKILDDAYGITSGTITTIHSAMNDQQVNDAYHDNLRLARAAGQSIIPVDTKLHKGIERIFPKFANKFEAIAVRVPTLNVTAMDLSVTIESSASVNDINQTMIDACQCTFNGIVRYTKLPLVSMDFNHDPHSVIVDGTQTRVSNGQLIKMLVWCDNEWAFANRMLDTALVLGNFCKQGDL